MLQHLRSLAVEEQFYLVWPLVLSVGLAAFRRARHMAPKGVAVFVELILASL